MLFEIKTDNNKPSIPKPKYPFYVKAIIHFIDDKKNFEVIQHEFFYNGLEKNGEFLSEDDFGDEWEYSLQYYDWDIDPKSDECYSLLWNFNIEHSKSWTDCGYEYDSEIDSGGLYFDLIDDEISGSFNCIRL